MGFLLDTDTCIFFLRDTRSPVRQRLSETDPEEVFLCSVTKGELLYGTRKSSRPAEERAKLLEFFGWFTSLPFDDEAAERYAAVRAGLSAAGRLIGPNDLLIASIALSRSLTVVTHNTAEFGRVAGLRLEDWTIPVAR